jgi:hypothetical protein
MRKERLQQAQLNQQAKTMQVFSKTIGFFILKANVLQHQKRLHKACCSVDTGNHQPLPVPFPLFG